jgi:uncharacterized protein YajQ (UPF0234 family)
MSHEEKKKDVHSPLMLIRSEVVRITGLQNDDLVQSHAVILILKLRDRGIRTSTWCLG